VPMLRRVSLLLLGVGARLGRPGAMPTQ
jgi:hypothetical protein